MGEMGNQEGRLKYRKHDVIIIIGSCDEDGDCMLESLYPQTNSKYWYGKVEKTSSSSNSTDSENSEIGYFLQSTVKVIEIPMEQKNDDAVELQRLKLYSTDGNEKEFVRDRGGKSEELGGDGKQFNSNFQNSKSDDVSQEKKRKKRKKRKGRKRGFRFARKQKNVYVERHLFGVQASVTHEAANENQRQAKKSLVGNTCLDGRRQFFYPWRGTHQISF